MQSSNIFCRFSFSVPSALRNAAPAAEPAQLNASDDYGTRHSVEPAALGPNDGEVKLFAINMKKLGEKVDSEAGKELAALLAKTKAASPKEEPSEAVKLEVDLGGDDDLGVTKSDDDDES